jgi:hypothetical protein
MPQKVLIRLKKFWYSGNNFYFSCMKYLLLISLLISSVAFTQIGKDTLVCKGLESANARASINSFGFSYGKALYISKDSLKKGFTITISDPSYKVIGFTLLYDCEGCDIWDKDVYGAHVTPENVSILRGLKKGETLDVECINLGREGKRYTVPGFVVMIIQ